MTVELAVPVVPVVRLAAAEEEAEPRLQALAALVIRLRPGEAMVAQPQAVHRLQLIVNRQNRRRNALMASRSLIMWFWR